MPDLTSDMANWLIGYRVIFTLTVAMVIVSWEVWRLRRRKGGEPPEGMNLHDQLGQAEGSAGRRYHRVG